jgi:hypothetical protein
VIRWQHRFAVTSDGFNWSVIGADAFGFANDWTVPSSFNGAGIGVPPFLSSYIVVAVNQQGSLIAASIDY